jgi:hypothetical protein
VAGIAVLRLVNPGFARYDAMHPVP